MREDLELETLEERRLSLRLILMYKVVEGLVPALPTYNFVKLARPKRIQRVERAPMAVVIGADSLDACTTPFGR
jgi:hypothetical protein